MKRRTAALAIALVVGVAAPSSTLAASITFFDSPLDDGTASGGIPSVLSPGSNQLDLFADPTAAPGRGVFGVATVLIETFGQVSITGFACSAADCLFVLASPMQLSLTGGDVIAGEFDVFRVGDLSLSVTGPGGLRLTSGSTLSADFTDTVIDGPQIIARTALAEPASALLLLISALIAALLTTRRVPPLGLGRRRAG